MRILTRMPDPSIIRSRVGLYVSNGKFVRNPREPREKDRIGGTIRWKSQEVKRTVPSPPRVMTKSKISG